jgi:hypothetical protein
LIRPCAQASAVIPESADFRRQIPLSENSFRLALAEKTAWTKCTLSLGRKSGLIMRHRNWSEEAWMDGMGVARADGAIVFDEFEEGDPRREISLEAQAEAGAFMTTHKRWHGRKYGVDWFAVQLQFGRGFTGRELAHRFGIGDSTISARKDEERWIRPMSERDRRRLSQFVWLAGIWRGAGDDPESRAALKASSEWRLPEEVAAPKFMLLDPKGAPVATTFNQETPDDVYYSSADPKREERFAMRQKLDDLIACMERDFAREDANPDCEMVQDDVAAVARGPDGPAPAGEAVDPLGAAEPVSA